jgi:hypothetical protein
MGRLCYPTQFRPIAYPGSLVEDFFRPEKEGMAHFVPSLPSEALAKEGQVQSLLIITRVAIQVKSEPENCHGTEFILRAGAGFRI